MGILKNLNDVIKPVDMGDLIHMCFFLNGNTSLPVFQHPSKNNSRG